MINLSVKNTMMAVIANAILAIPFCSAVAMPLKMDPEMCQPARLFESSENVLACYLSLDEPPINPALLGSKHINDVTLQHREFTSQTWPKDSQFALPWRHRLDVYTPQKARAKTAILVVAGGTRYSTDGSKESVLVENEYQRFAEIARRTHAAVFVLKDVPNQAIALDDQIPRTEDDLIAYTFSRYLEDPINLYYMPLLLPMTKSVVRAMDFAQTLDINGIGKPEHFLVTGLSKRAWTTWLTAAADPRVVAIAPVVYDGLNLIPSFANIAAFYSGNTPSTLNPYAALDILGRAGTPEMLNLVKMQDPFAYATTHMSKEIHERLKTMPKFIINSSGDDYFVPTNAQFYFPLLPDDGRDFSLNKRLRYMPNTSHYVSTYDDVLIDALINFYAESASNEALSMLNWHMTPFSYHMNFKQAPDTITLWIAHNTEKRDFRYAEGIIYHPIDLSAAYSEQGSHLHLDVELTRLLPEITPATGYIASFIEVGFSSIDVKGKSLKHTETTEVSVIPVADFAQQPDANEN